MGCLVVALLLVMEVNSYTCVYAMEEEEETVIEILDSTEGLNLEELEVEHQRLLALGRQLKAQVGKGRQSTIMALPNVPLIKQNDNQWKNEIMLEDGLSIGTHGCCLTSFTMAQQYFGGTDTPRQVNENLGEKACPFYYYDAANEYNYTVTTCIMYEVSYADTLSYVMAAVYEDHPVLIGMEDEDGNTHFVLAFGYA